MITIFRMIRLWQLKIKWRLAIYQFADKQLAELVRHPEKIEEKIMPYLTELIHNSAHQA